MNEMHPLVEKQLIKQPLNWSEWLERYKAEDDPMALLSLLHYGPEMPEAGKTEYEAEAEATILYLRLAKDYFNKDQFDEETEFNQNTNIFTCPRYTLGKTAFQTLCKYGFQKTESQSKPWEYFLWNDRVLVQLLAFLGTDGYFEDGAGGDRLHSWFCYTKERYQEILKTFCLGLAKYLIELPPLPAHIDEETRKQQTVFWRSHRHAAIKILWYLDRLDMLIEHKDMVDEILLGELEKFILARDIEVPISTRSTKTIRRKPRNVHDVLKIKPGSYCWRNGGSELAKAACIYLGLTSEVD